MWSGAMVMWFERMTKCVHAEEGNTFKNWISQEIRMCTQISTARKIWGDPHKCLQSQAQGHIKNGLLL